MGFFDFFKSDDPEPEPELTIESETTIPAKITRARGRGQGSEPLDTTEPNVKGRDPRALESGLETDFELKSTTPALKGLDLLKQSGELDPEYIEKIAPNLQGQGAKRPTTSSINPDLIDDLIDELLKGNTIDYKSLSDDQKKELTERLQEPRAPTTEKDFESGTMKGDLATDVIPGVSEDIPPTPTPTPTLEKPETQQAKPPPEETQIVATEGQSTTTQDVTAIAHSTTTDTLIFRQSEINHPDEHTIFKSALSGLSVALVEYIKKVDPNVEIALSVMENIGFQLPDVINGAVRNVVSQISQISHMDTAGLRGSKNNRIKLRLKNEEHKMLKNAVFYPFIIIAIKFYSITKQINLDLNYFTGVALSQVLKKYLNLPSSNIDYAISLLQNFPNELGEAYLNNRNEVVGITRTQSMAIEKYIELIKTEYKNYFNEDYMSAVKKTEHGTSTLPEVLNHLNNPRMLNVVYSVMMTIDNFILTVQNNDNVLLGLMGLVYAEASQSGDLVDANIISNSNVLGYVYFQGSMPMMGRKDIELEALKEMSKPKDERRLNALNLIENKEKVAMWEDNNGNAIVTIRGTDHKDSGDIIDNFLNFGGSLEAYNTRRYLTARKFINEKESEISNTGRGSLKVLGYSLGGATATRLAQDYPHLKIKVYNPIISNSQMQKDLFKKLKELNSNIEFFYVDEDPISTNLKDYRNDFKMTMVKKNKFFSSHSLNNHG